MFSLKLDPVLTLDWDPLAVRRQSDVLASDKRILLDRPDRPRRKAKASTELRPRSPRSGASKTPARSRRGLRSPREARQGLRSRRPYRAALASAPMLSMGLLPCADGPSSSRFLETDEGVGELRFRAPHPRVAPHARVEVGGPAELARVQELQRLSDARDIPLVLKKIARPGNP